MTDLLYTDVEDALRDSVRSTLARGTDLAAVARLYDEPGSASGDLWRALADGLGIAALLVPESLGGAGAGAREAAVVLEELGRSLAPVPYLTSAVVATTALLAAGEQTHLAALADGSRTAVLVLPWSRHAGDWSPAGDSVAPVAGAIGADLFLAPVQRDGELALVAFDAAQVEVEPLVSLDMSRPLARVGLPADGGEIVARGDVARTAVDRALLTGAALLASEQVGIARWCLESTVEYAKTRIQFARPIGSFQAIKHRLADLYTELVQAEGAARYAAATLATDDPDQAVAAAVAQSWCSDVAVHAAEEALQLHGGIGMTWEHPVHLFLKRAKSGQLALGTPDRHRADLAVLLDLRL